jgi:hypothetical protein
MVGAGDAVGAPDADGDAEPEPDGDAEGNGAGEGFESQPTRPADTISATQAATERCCARVRPTKRLQVGPSTPAEAEVVSAI